MTFNKRKMKKQWLNVQICLCGHGWEFHSVAWFKFAGHCESCSCNAYKRDKSKGRTYYMTPDLSLCDRVRGLFGMQIGCDSK